VASETKITVDLESELLLREPEVVFERDLGSRHRDGPVLNGRVEGRIQPAEVQTERLVHAALVRVNGAGSALRRGAAGAGEESGGDDEPREVPGGEPCSHQDSFVPPGEPGKLLRRV